MSGHSFKKAYLDENQHRNEYQQKLIQQQKGFQHQFSQPFHPLQAVEKPPEAPKKKSIQLDMIDEPMEDLPDVPPINLPKKEDRSSHLPFYIHQPLQPVAPEYNVASRPPSYVQNIQDVFPHVQPALVPSRPDSALPTTMLPSPEQSTTIEKDYVYKAFLMYFDNPRLSKMNDVHDGYSLYYAKVKSMIHEYRYLIVMTGKDYEPKGSIMYLKQLPWKSFQLRVLDSDFPVPEVSFRKENNGVFDDEIFLKERDKISKKVIYQCKFNPLTVELLPSKKSTIYDYPDQSTLESAMDTFQCVIYFS